MADIDDINAAQTVKIVGSDPTGVEQTPVGSVNYRLGVALNDDQGTPYTIRNPLAITGSFDKFFSLINASGWMANGSYDRVTPTYSGANNEILTIAFLSAGNTIAEAVVDFTSDLNWDITLKRYLLDDDGGFLLDDDGTPLNLDY